MKKIFLLSMLVPLVMICSCQKKDAATEQQLAQRKVELDAREEALAERKSALDEMEKALDQREKVLAERENANKNARTTAIIQRQTAEPPQGNAEGDSRIQQLPAEVRALLPHTSQVTAGDPAKQERPAARQLGPEDLQRQWQQNSDKAKLSDKTVFPAAEAGSPTSSPAVERTSPSSSPIPQ